jgi:hypothetical protein
MSDFTGEAGVKVMKGMTWDFLGEGHDDVTEVALDREDNDPVEEKSESLSLDVMEAESSASESAASGELAKQARSVRRLRMCERRIRAVRTMVARMTVLISTRASFSVSRSSERADKGVEGWMRAEAAHMSRCSASPTKQTRTRPGSMKRSNSLPPVIIHVCHSMPACLAAMKIGFGGMHEGEGVRQRRLEPRFGSDGDHDEERYGMRIVERACCRVMKRAGVMVEVKGRVRKVMAGARAADTVIE